MIFTAAPALIGLALIFAIDRTVGWLAVAVVALFVLFSQVGMPA